MTGQKQKMLAGELYIADDPELIADNRRISEWMDRYNAGNSLSQPERQALMAEAFAQVARAATSGRRSGAITATTSASAAASSSTSTAASSTWCR